MYICVPGVVVGVSMSLVVVSVVSVGSLARKSVIGVESPKGK